VKLALGTVQFGIPYGIANQQGQVSKTEAAAILAYAHNAGMDTLDTAIAYGDSENTLGTLGIGGWNVISKLPPMPADCNNVDAWVDEQLAASLQRLKVSSLQGLLLHRPEQLLLPKQGQQLYQALRRLQEEKQVAKIGVSIYQPGELDALLAVYNGFDLIQAPFNILDRSLINSGWLQKLHDAGTEIHIRSAFLQGLLLMPSSQRPEKFHRWQALLQQWDAWLEHNQLTALEACLHYPLSIPEISKVVVGTDSLVQLQQIIAASNRHDIPLPPDTLQSHDPQLVNPAQWGNL
jgi:hypothetical protein